MGHTTELFLTWSIIFCVSYSVREFLFIRNKMVLGRKMSIKASGARLNCFLVRVPNQFLLHTVQFLLLFQHLLKLAALFSQFIFLSERKNYLVQRFFSSFLLTNIFLDFEKRTLIYNNNYGVHNITRRI